MLFVYDIVLNWCEKTIYDFYEWEKSDDIDHIKRIILLKATKNTLLDFMNYEVDLDKDFLSRIHNLSETYQNNKKIPYAFIVTDGITSIAIKSDKTGKVRFRSKLIPEEEDEVLCVSTKLKETILKYIKSKKMDKTSNLTRKEKKIKDYLSYELKKAYDLKDNEIILYLYSEYSNNQIDDVEKAYCSLIESLKEIDENHHTLYKILNMIKTGSY